MTGNAPLKRLGRDVLRAVSPRLLDRVQVARARRRYLGDPRQGPRRLLVEPTTACNHRCVMCMDHSPRLERPTPPRSMPFERIERLLRDAAAMGTTEVWLAGRGEPLLHPDVVQIIALAHALGMRSQVTTNGGRLTPEMADLLCEAGLDMLSVSINAGRPETYARVHRAPAGDRARVLEAMERISRRPGPRPDLMASIVLSALNHAELLEFGRDALAAGARTLVVGGMRGVPFDGRDLFLKDADWARVREDLAGLRDLAAAAGARVLVDNIPPEPGTAAGQWPYASMGCFVGHMFAVVDVEGGVRGCCSCVDALGSLEEASFAQVWRSEAYRRFRIACREIPSTGLTPAHCGCRECGNIDDNIAVQREVRLRFSAGGRPSRFASRLDLAAALWRHFRDVLPDRGEGEGLRDVTAGGEPGLAVRRLQALGIVAGCPQPAAAPLFEPDHIACREEVAGIAQRALEAMGAPADVARRLIANAAPRQGPPTELVLKTEVERWLAAVRAAWGRAPHPPA